MMAKIGTFDWILDYHQLRQYWQEPYLSSSSSSSLRSKEQQHVLVIGCGTSPLSAQLQEDGFHSITSLDNDLECISHMKKLYASSAASLLEWYHYDLVTRQGSHQQELQSMSNRFDLIIDKGTLDAILVEGTCYEMLSEIHRLLNQNGVYFVCSIHTEALLLKLLSIEALGFEVQCYHPLSSLPSTSTVSSSQEIEESNDHSCVIAVCRKTSLVDVVDIDALATAETRIMNEYYQQEEPFLTTEVEAEIRLKYLEFIALKQSEWKAEHEVDNVPRLNIKDAYLILFEDVTSDYSFELFEEDLASFPTTVPEMLSLDEAISFVKCKQ